MANFFTRLAERSLGLSPVVQSAIAPRFSSVPVMADEVAPHWNREVESFLAPVNPNSSARMTPLQPYPTVQDQLSAPEPDLVINLVQRQAPPYLSIAPSLPSQLIHPASTPPLVQDQLSAPEPDLVINLVQRQAPPYPSIALPLPSQPIHPASILPQPSSRQPIGPATDSVVPAQSIAEQSNQVASLKPFHILQAQEQILVASHPTLAIALPNPEIPNAPEIVSNRSLVRPITLPNRGDRLIESQQVPFAQPTQPAAQVDLRSAVPSPPLPPVSAEPTAAPPTIRVSIGRVEVRAIMPAPPTPKVAPVRPRPAVSLNDYLKQRGSKP